MESTSIKNVLISDDIDEICVQRLTSSGINVEKNTKLTSDQLKEKIKDFDALIVRSATKVTKDVIEAGKCLKLIGRAGTGVDNIDLEAATEKGIVVMNTPAGNSRSAAELTCSMIMCLARRIPQADFTMKQGKWERKAFMGTEVYGKTLAIIGLGRIGREVASRMRAFGMKTVGYDPIINAEQSQKFDVEWLPLNKIWSEADYITVHVPLMKETENLIDAATLDKCKKGVCIINCARGGIVNEKDLLAALESGKCAGAAFDVFEQEPPKNYDLMKHKNAICTPHIGASTVEAQTRVAQEIAEQIILYDRGQELLGAVNGQALVCTFKPGVKEILKSVEDGTHLLHNLLADNKFESVRIDIPSTFGNSIESAVSAAFNIGIQKAKSVGKVNLVNVHLSAKDTGTKVTVKFESPDKFITITVEKCSRTSGQHSVKVFDTTLGTSLVAIDKSDFVNPVLLSGTLVVFKGDDKIVKSSMENLAGKSQFICRQKEQTASGEIYVIASIDKIDNAAGGDATLKPVCVLKF